MSNENIQINFPGLLANSAFSSPLEGKKGVQRVLFRVKKNAHIFLLENMFHLQNIKKSTLALDLA